MNVVTTRSGNKAESYNDKSVEVKNNDPIPPEKEIVKEDDKEEPYVAPPPYKPPKVRKY